MNTQEVATRLAEYCKKGEWEAAHDELYADDAISIEPYAMDGYEKKQRARKPSKKKDASSTLRWKKCIPWKYLNRR